MLISNYCCHSFFCFISLMCLPLVSPFWNGGIPYRFGFFPCTFFFTVLTQRKQQELERLRVPSSLIEDISLVSSKFLGSNASGPLWHPHTDTSTQIKINLFKISFHTLNDLFYLCVYLCAHEYMCMLPTEASGGHKILQRWSYCPLCDVQCEY